MTQSDQESRELGVVVVNFGSHELLEANLMQLDLRALGGGIVAVVDNYYSSTERARVENLCNTENWELLAPMTNLGFGVAANLGAKRCFEMGCNRVLLLNPDVHIESGALVDLVMESELVPNSLLSPRLHRSDGTVWFSGAEVDLSRGLTRSNSQHLSVVHAWLTAACLIAERTTWENLGGFDSRYFLYWEDVELSQRHISNGGVLAVADGVVATHDVGATQEGHGKSPTYGYFMCRNRLQFGSQRVKRATRIRWLLNAPMYALRVCRRDGFRYALRHPALVGAAIRGTIAGAILMIRSLRFPA